MDESGTCPTDPGGASTGQPILDLDHLDRVTLGDGELGREVLQLFDRQATMLGERLRCASASAAASCAHTLKGAARGIGAWRLAHAAAEVERTAGAGEAQALAVAQLVGAVDETRDAIARHLERS